MRAVDDAVSAVAHVAAVSVAAGGVSWLAMLAVDTVVERLRAAADVVREASDQPRLRLQPVPVPHVGVHRLEGQTRRMRVQPR